MPSSMLFVGLGALLILCGLVLIAGRMIWDRRGNDLTCLQIGDLHSPEAADVVNSVVACAVHCVGSEDSRVRPDARYSVAARVNQVQIMAAPVTGLRLLENRSG